MPGRGVNRAPGAPVSNAREYRDPKNKENTSGGRAPSNQGMGSKRKLQNFDEAKKVLWERIYMISLIFYSLANLRGRPSVRLYTNILVFADIPLRHFGFKEAVIGTLVKGS